MNNNNSTRCCQGFFVDWLKTSHGDLAGPKTCSTLLNAIKKLYYLKAHEEMIKEVTMLKLH